MKKLLSTATAFALLAGAAHAEGKLSVYHWFEYIPQELVDKFTAETGIKSYKWDVGDYDACAAGIAV